MFGYVSINKPEMKVKDFNTFRGFYCGLCKTIKKEYSETARFMLNYDCTFLYVLCASSRDGKADVAFERCPTGPKKKAVLRDHGAEYAAAINVLLGAEKLLDTANDEGSIAAKAGFRLYSKVYKRAAENYPKAADCIKQGLSELAKIEKKKSASIDEPADAFAKMLGNIFVFAPTDYNKDVLYQLGYNIGRWIYIADAYNDMEEDGKKGNYNPVLLRYNAGDNIKENIRYTLNLSSAQAQSAYELLDIKRYKAILDNIIYEGMYHKAMCILNRENGRKKDEDGSI